MRVISLASGSKGNAYAVMAHNGEVLIIDCGLSLAELKRRFVQAGFSEGVPELKAVLLTHSHADHVSGLKPLLAEREVAVYANPMTSETVVADYGVDEEAFACFENEQEFSIGQFAVLPFPVPHDTSDPVGYLIRVDGQVYFHGTDIGVPLASVGRRLSEADFATLESNHDPQRLRLSARPTAVIRRIAGPRGHLANEEACELIRRFASPRLKRLALAHLSRDCNEPDLAERMMLRTLAEMGRGDVSLKVFAQDAVVGL